MFEAQHGYACRGQKTLHPIYRAWKNIKQWCTNPNNPRWHCYGGRGIQICKRWADSFPHFLADVLAECGERPSKEYSLDRRDNDRGYERGNLRWTTASVQRVNSRRDTPEVLATIAPWTEERRAALAELNRSAGKRAKQSATQRGQRRSLEAIAKTAAKHRGMKRSPEACAAISAGRRAANLAKRAQVSQQI